MKKYTIEIKWAFIFIAMMLLWMTLERAFGLHDEHIDQHAVYTNLVMIPAFVVYVLALLDKRKNYYGGKMNYLQGFVSGLIITLIVTLFTPLTQYITSTVISPDYFDNIIAYSVQTGELSQEVAEEHFTLKNYIIMSTLFAPVAGILTSALVAIFTRKK